MSVQPSLALNVLRKELAWRREHNRVSDWGKLTIEEALMSSMNMTDDELLGLRCFGRGSLRAIRSLASELEKEPFYIHGLVRLD